MKIDTHCHLSSEGLAQAISKYTPFSLGIDRKNKILSTALAETMPLLNEDERISDMDEMGVDVNVLSVGTYILFSEQQLNQSAQTRLRISQVVNDYLASICQRFSGRLMAFADVPVTLGDAGIKEMIRSLDELNLQGIGLVTNFHGRYLDSSEFQPFFQEVNRRKVTAFIHPFNPPSTPQTMIDMEMYRVVGFPCETTLTGCRMAYSGFMEKYPDINFIFSHAGGTIPFLWPRIDYTYHGDLPHPPTYYLKQHYYDTALSDTNSLMLTYQRVGDHLIFGTDYPFKKAHISRTLATIEKMEVSEAVKGRILGGNALSLFGKAGRV